MKRRFVKDVSYLSGWNCALRVNQPVITFRVRGHNRMLNPPKPKVHLIDLGIKPCKFGY